MTDVDIANLALSYLGDAANVTTLDPAEGSAQADHCARFLPIAKRELLESFPWSFALRTAKLARYAPQEGAKYFDYALPSDCVRLLNILREPLSPLLTRPDNVQFIELMSGQTKVIRTLSCQAYAVYISEDVSTNRYSAEFTQALAWSLAAKLAGPIHGGQGGSKVAQNCLVQSRYFAEQAKVNDANQSRDTPFYICGLSGDYQQGEAAWH